MYEQYYEDIPIGRENAITYQQLCLKWHCNERKVRSILHKLSSLDLDDRYILIGSSHGKGFYKTDDVAEIEKYIKECTNRAKNIFITIRKARKVLKDTKPAGEGENERV